MCLLKLRAPTALLFVVAPLQNGWTPLRAAAQYGHIEVVHALIAAGASVNEVNDVRSIACIWGALVWFIW